jgi:hypothetical protein
MKAAVLLCTPIATCTRAAWWARKPTVAVGWHRSGFESVVERGLDRAVSALEVVRRGPAGCVQEVVDVQAEEEEPNRAAEYVEAGLAADGLV